MLNYRQAVLDDVKNLSRFTDWWLAGRGFHQQIHGAVNDCFISPGQHRKYINKYNTWICTSDEDIVGWAVVQHNDIMIHLLVAGDYRGIGIGSKLLRMLSPRFVRSKSDQTSGNPISFYQRAGYRKIDTVQSRSRLDIDVIKPFRKANIDILELASE